MFSHHGFFLLGYVYVPNLMVVLCSLSLVIDLFPSTDVSSKKKKQMQKLKLQLLQQGDYIDWAIQHLDR